MKVIYPVVFTETKDKENTILVYIPDLDGMTEGYGIEDAISMAKDYIGNALCEKSRNVRRNITLPEWLDDMASKCTQNRIRCSFIKNY